MTEVTIKPTRGRIVWYKPQAGDVVLAPYLRSHGEEPMAAIVTHVWSDRVVNLLVLNPDGGIHSRTSVEYKQGEGHDMIPHWEWMPYQLGQAAKTQELERMTGGERNDPRGFPLEEGPNAIEQDGKLIP